MFGVLEEDTQMFFTGVVGTITLLFVLYFVIVVVSKQVYASSILDNFPAAGQTQIVEFESV